MSVIADFKEIIQQVSVNKDLKRVYAIFGGMDQRMDQTKSLLVSLSVELQMLRLGKGNIVYNL